MYIYTVFIMVYSFVKVAIFRYDIAGRHHETVERRKRHSEKKSCTCT